MRPALDDTLDELALLKAQVGDPSPDSQTGPRPTSAQRIKNLSALLADANAKNAKLLDKVEALSAQVHQQPAPAPTAPAPSQDSILGLPSRALGSRHQGVVAEVAVQPDYAASRKYKDFSYATKRCELEKPSTVAVTPESKELHTVPDTQLPIPCFREPSSVLKLHFRTTKHHTRAGIGLQTGWARYQDEHWHAKEKLSAEVADEAIAKATIDELCGGYIPDEELHPLIVGTRLSYDKEKKSYSPYNGLSTIPGQAPPRTEEQLKEEDAQRQASEAQKSKERDDEIAASSRQVTELEGKLRERRAKQEKILII